MNQPTKTVLELDQYARSRIYNARASVSQAKVKVFIATSEVETAEKYLVEVLTDEIKRAARSDYASVEFSKDCRYIIIEERPDV